jgi:hypothetical protein
MADTSASPHLYTSRQQYEVANGQVLGSLRHPDIGVSSCNLDPEAQPLCPLSPKRVLRRAKTVPRKSLYHNDEGKMIELGSPDSLRSEFYATAAVPILLVDEEKSEIEDEELEESTTFVSDEPPQIPPLRRISKFKPKLRISIPENKITSSVLAERHKVKCETDDESLEATPPRLQDNGKAGETLSNHVADARDDDNVFSTPDSMSHVDRPATQLETKVYVPTGAYGAYKTSSGLSLVSSSTATATPPRLRHTALHSSPGSSLRSRYSASEPPSEMERSFHLTPSLEDELSADDLEVFEEDAEAVVAPLLCGIEPNIVDIRYPGIVEVLGRRKASVSSRHDSCDDEQMLPATVDRSTTLRMQLPMLPISPIVAQLMPAPLRYPSPGANVSILPFHLPLHIVEAIAFSAAWGDVECQALASNLRKQLARAHVSTVGSQRVTQEQYLLRKSHLVQELDSLVRCEHLPGNLFETVRSQLFPTTTTELMEARDFTTYICRAVHTLHLTEGKAEEILQLAIGDEGFAQISPEEMSLERQAFDLGSHVYDSSIDDGHYVPQQRAGRGSLFFTKAAQMCRLSFWKRLS